MDLGQQLLFNEQRMAGYFAMRPRVMKNFATAFDPAQFPNTRVEVLTDNEARLTSMDADYGIRISAARLGDERILTMVSLVKALPRDTAEELVARWWIDEDGNVTKIGDGFPTMTVDEKAFPGDVLLQLQEHRLASLDQI